MSQPTNEWSGAERWVGLTILLCLAGIVVGVVHRQFSFNPAVLVASTVLPQTSKTAFSTASGETPSVLPPELSALGAQENFTADNLYDKIDGKAELYTAAGFVGMQAQRFALKATNDVWMEWFVYDMGTLPQAFSVFSLQRRSEGKTLDLTPFAYQCENALFFVCGKNYIEAVTAMPTDAMMSAMRAMARQFVATHPPGPMRIPELELFPPDNLEAGSQNLQTVNAFGFDRFTNVFTAKYSLPSGTTNIEAQAFFELTASPAAAATLRDAWRAFLVANGGKEMESGSAGTLGKPINFMDGIEIVFARNNAVAGVHAAPDAATAATVARRLADSLGKRTNE
jgi:hypothetical protein